MSTAHLRDLSWQQKAAPTPGESAAESALPRAVPAKDWLIGVLGFLAIMGVTAGVGRLFMGLRDSTALSLICN